MQVDFITVVVEFVRESLPTAFRMIDIREVYIMDVIEYFREVIVSDFNIVNATLSDDNHE